MKTRVVTEMDQKQETIGRMAQQPSPPGGQQQQQQQQPYGGAPYGQPQAGYQQQPYSANPQQVEVNMQGGTNLVATSEVAGFDDNGDGQVDATRRRRWSLFRQRITRRRRWSIFRPRVENEKD